MTRTRMHSLLKIGGEGGDRTHGPVARTAVFETARFGHSRTSPLVELAMKFRLVQSFARMHASMVGCAWGADSASEHRSRNGFCEAHPGYWK